MNVRLNGFRSLPYDMWRKTTSLEVYMLRYPPMTEGYIFLPRAVRPEVKKFDPRSEVDHLSITTDKVGGFYT